MLRHLVSKRIARLERRLGTSLEEFSHVLAVSWLEFWRLCLLVPLSGRRRALPPEPFYVARLAMVTALDCGGCVQAEVYFAKRAGMPAAYFQAVVNHTPEALPEELAQVYRFATSIIKATGEEAAYRDALRRRYGERGFVELCMAIATRGTFPLLKRGLGHLTSCSLIPPRFDW